LVEKMEMETQVRWIVSMDVAMSLTSSNTHTQTQPFYGPVGFYLGLPALNFEFY